MTLSDTLTPTELERAGPDRGKALRVMMTMRVVVVTTLLGSALFVQLFYELANDTLYFLIGLTYLLTVFYAVLVRPLRDSRAFVFAQLLIDMLLVSLLVMATGAAESAFIILYYPVVVTAAVALGRGTSFALASVGGAMLAAVVLAANSGLIDLGVIYPYSLLPLNSLLYTIGLHLFALAMLAALSGYLASMLQHTAVRLSQRTVDLQRLRVLNQSIVQSITSGIVTTDLEGRVTFANPAALRLFEVPAERVLSSDIRRWIDYNPSAPEPIFGDETWSREMLLRRGGDEREGDEGAERIDVGVTRALLMGPGGDPIGKLYLIADLRAQKALRAQLSIGDRLTAAGELSAAIAHEIRNPLGAISGSAQMIQKASDLPEDLLAFLDIIVRESERLSATLNEFLAFARPPVFSPVRIDLVAVVRETVALLSHSTGVTPAHRISFSADGLDELVTRVDPNMMRQLIYNLATNAVRAMPEGGMLRIKLRREDGEAVLTVSDNGVGIAADELQQLFQPLTSRSHGGIGLGMAIVYRIVQEHGGKITVRSAPGVGTSVTTALPIEGAEQPGISVRLLTAEP